MKPKLSETWPATWLLAEEEVSGILREKFNGGKH